MQELIGPLTRIAEALERLAPPPPAAAELPKAEAFIWHPEGDQLDPVAKINRLDISLLKGIDRVRDILLDNTRRFANGLPANNALLWGARGMGKSSLVKAVHGEVAAESKGLLGLVEIHREDIPTLPRLLELPPAIRALLEARRLEMGHARALLTLSPDLASKLASDAAEQGWSVREVEHRAQQFAAGKVPVNGKKAKPAKAAPQPDIASLETELSESLGTRVTIAHGRGGKGKLIIQYTDLDTLDGVLERLRPRV